MVDDLIIEKEFTLERNADLILIWKGDYVPRYNANTFGRKKIFSVGVMNQLVPALPKLLKTSIPHPTGNFCGPRKPKQFARLSPAQLIPNQILFKPIF